MTEYCLIESRDPFESRDVHFTYELAADLSKQGHTVILFLVQNGVLPARVAAETGLTAVAASPGVSVVVDDFSLRERGIKEERVHDELLVSSLDVVVDCLARGARTIWH